MNNELTTHLFSKGYWPAVAQVYLDKKDYARVIEYCVPRAAENPDILSAKVIYARALYHSGQFEIAEEKFYGILQIDPDNLVALKYLGDIKFRHGDKVGSFLFYSRVLKIDPYTRGLSCPLEKTAPAETRITIIKKGGDIAARPIRRFRQLPFKTETAGDILLAQGHTRMAMEIFRRLAKKSSHPRILDKIRKTQALHQKPKE
jgi:tetratricopeptide (TPR) repeat protein